MAQWAGVVLTEIYDMELDDAFIVVKLKQLAASIMFEFIDEVLQCQSSLKTEVCFGAKNEDPRTMIPPTRLTRAGALGINPFYPSPYHNQKGSISADLIILESRLEPVSKTNLFAIIEIKFQNDRIKDQQFKSYERLLKESKEVKQTKYGKSNNYSSKGLVKGGCISLFRYPEDKALVRGEDKEQSKSQQGCRKK
ncbi:hypothetical protein [Acinetobacter populi]|uniref:hypothetical protein n=1 Tax=Acinetobacter populi TaxID=1582270 RepID=UPI00148CFA43|nr:hypothetical protein [Acinetobacter populi]